MEPKLEGYIGIYQGTQVFLTERKNYKPMEDTYIILEDSLDTIYNGYVIGVYDKKTGGIVFNPKSIKFPFDPITKKIVKEDKDEVRDNKDEMKLVKTTLYYENPSGFLEENKEVEKEKNEIEIENSEIEIENLRIFQRKKNK